MVVRLARVRGGSASSRAGLVLVTSRVGDPRAGAVADVRRLESLGEGDGAQVLLDLAPHAGDRAAAESLSSQLGGLPLALYTNVCSTTLDRITAG